MRGWIVAAASLALGLSLAGCGRAQDTAASAPVAESVAAPAPSAAPTPAQGGSAGREASQGPGAPDPAATPPGLPMLAYSYSATLETPSERVGGLMRAHERACAAAGPTACQVLQADLSADRASEAVRATLRIRAQPQWLATFRASLERETRAAGGRVVTSATATEDLTRSIIDTDARLRALTLSRTRIEQLLATRSGSLQEVIEAERELARVQGDIDSLQSELAVMRARVATSAMTITYQSAGVAVSEGTFAPLERAGDEFVGNLVSAVAVLITLTSVLLPFVLVGLLILWLVMFARRRGWMKRKARPVAPLAGRPQENAPPPT